MSLISKSLPSLTGGVSQQADELRLANQCSEQINFKSSLVNGLQNRKPLVYKNSASGNGAFYPIDRDDDGKYNLIINSSGLSIYNESGVAQTVSYGSGALSYLSSHTSNPYNDYKVLTLADYTYIVNTNKTVALTSERYENWNNHALVFIKQVAASTTYTLTINGTSHSVGYGGTHSSSGLPSVYQDGTEIGETNMSTKDIAARLISLFGNPFGNIYFSQMGSVIWVHGASYAALSNVTVGLADTRGDEYSHLITNKVQQFSDLPTIAPDGYVCKVIGSVANNADDYYVMFVTDNGSTFGKGTWQECAQPNSVCSLDASTMPHVLVHNANGTWTMKQQTWVEKLTGDEDSVPTPSFVGKKLRNIFLYSNRMCFLTEDLLCMSAAADFENFWNETATALTDADPIFISASTNKVADLYDVGMQDDDLIIFGSHAQFKLSRDNTLSPKTAAINMVSSNPYTKGTGIVAAGNRLYAGYKKGNFFSMYEYGTNAYTSSKEAASITSHIPNYINWTGTILRVTGSENTETLTVMSDTVSDTLFIYQYYTSNNQKLQSSWSKFTFSGYQVKGVFYRENTMWILLYRTSSAEYIIATMDMAETTTDLSNITFCIDMQYQTTTSAISGVENKSQITLPTYLRNSTNLVCVEYVNSKWREVEIITVANTPSIVQLKTVANRTVIIGQKYERKYVFTKPMISSKSKDSGDKVYTTGRWQMQTLSLNYVNSGVFNVKVQAEYVDSDGYTYKFSGASIGTKTTVLNNMIVSSGTFTVPIRLKNLDVKATIITDSLFPTVFTSVVWQGLYITKVKQV